MKTRLSIVAGGCALLLAVPLFAGGTNKNAAKAASIRAAWAPETISGKIITVDPGNNLVVIKTADGTPFDLDVTSHTRINTSDRSVALKDLIMDLNKQVSVKFIPERRGDVAESIRITG
jgi:hypothetical protein